MNIDLNKAMKDCEGIEKVQERTNTGVVSWTFFNFDIIYIETKIWLCNLWKKQTGERKKIK